MEKEETCMWRLSKVSVTSSLSFIAIIKEMHVDNSVHITCSYKPV